MIIIVIITWPIWILFIYAIAFASGLAYRGNYFVFLEAFYAEFSETLKKIIDLISPFMSLILFGVCGFYSLYMVEMGFYEHSPTLQVIMVVPFLSILILSLSISYFSLLVFLKKIKFWKSWFYCWLVFLSFVFAFDFPLHFLWVYPVWFTFFSKELHWWLCPSRCTLVLMFLFYWVSLVLL